MREKSLYQSQFPMDQVKYTTALICGKSLRADIFPKNEVGNTLKALKAIRKVTI